MPLRRRAAALVAAATALTALAAPAALADGTPSATRTPTAGSARADLYGTGDPTYDGVWRQSYAIQAISVSGYVPAPTAVDWLLAQQCADGGWPSYRADTAKACDPKTEDTNATGAALTALGAAGTTAKTAPAVKRGHDWLLTVQNADGGWSYNPGGASDPDSTAIVVGALRGEPASTPGSKGRTAFDALRGFQFGCTAKAADRGAFGYPDTGGKLTPNAKATADALNGLVAGGLVEYQGQQSPAPTPKAADCAADPRAYAELDTHTSAFAAADWLAAQLRAGGGHLDAVTPGSDTPTPDYGTTADAAAALAKLRPAEAKTAYAWLAAHSASWSKGNPAALAQVVLAHSAIFNTGATALAPAPVQQLIALGPAPTRRPTPGRGSGAAADSSPASHTTTWLVVAAVFAASAAATLALTTRRRRTR